MRLLPGSHHRKTGGAPPGSGVDLRLLPQRCQRAAQGRSLGAAGRGQRRQLHRGRREVLTPAQPPPPPPLPGVQGRPGARQAECANRTADPSGALRNHRPPPLQRNRRLPHQRTRTCLPGSEPSTGDGGKCPPLLHLHLHLQPSRQRCRPLLPRAAEGMSPSTPQRRQRHAGTRLTAAAGVPAGGGKPMLRSSPGQGPPL